MARLQILHRRFLKNLVQNVVAINNQPNGKNINENCGSFHLEKLQAKVLEEKADFGVAFDGDADRALFVDEKGNLVDGDAVLWIMAQHLSEHGKLNNQTVVATVMSNHRFGNRAELKKYQTFANCGRRQICFGRTFENKFSRRRRTIGTYYFSPKKFGWRRNDDGAFCCSKQFGKKAKLFRK